MSDNPVTFQEQGKSGEYPNKGVLYNWTRPSQIRNELMKAGVIAKVNGRWLFNPPKWRDYCSDSFRIRNQ